MYKQGHEGKSSSPPADTTHDRDSENSFLQGAKQLTKTRNKKILRGNWQLKAVWLVEGGSIKMGRIPTFVLAWTWRPSHRHRRPTWWWFKKPDHVQLGFILRLGHETSRNASTSPRVHAGEEDHGVASWWIWDVMDKRLGKREMRLMWKWSKVLHDCWLLYRRDSTCLEASP